MKEDIVTFTAAILLLSILAFIFAWPVQVLWNSSLVGAIDGINPIGFWQALGINILCGILFRNNSTSNKQK